MTETILPEYPNCDLRTFKVVVDSTTNVYKVGQSRYSMGVRTVDKVPKGLLSQLYVQPTSKSAELAYQRGKKYEATSGYMIMENEAVPALSTYTNSGKMKTFKVCTLFYIDNFKNEYNVTFEDFIAGINYIIKTMVNNDRVEDKFHLFTLDNEGRMVKVSNEIVLPKA